MVEQIDPARTEHNLVLEEARRWPGWEPDLRTNPGLLTLSVLKMNERTQFYGDCQFGLVAAGVDRARGADGEVGGHPPGL